MGKGLDFGLSLIRLKLCWVSLRLELCRSNYQKFRAVNARPPHLLKPIDEQKTFLPDNFTLCKLEKPIKCLFQARQSPETYII